MSAPKKPSPRKRRSQTEAVISDTPVIASIIQHDVGDLLSKALAMHLISAGTFNKISSSSESNLEKAERLLVLVGNMSMLEDSTAFHSFLEIFEAIPAYKSIASSLEKKAIRLRSSTSLSPSKKTKWSDDKENDPSTADVFDYKALEVQHQKPLDDLKKIHDERLNQLKALKDEMEEKDRKIAVLTDSLQRERTEKSELYKDKLGLRRDLNDVEEKLADAEQKLIATELKLTDSEQKWTDMEEKFAAAGETLEDVLLEMRKPRSKSKTSPNKCRTRSSTSVDDRCQRKLTSYGILHKKCRTPPPPYSVS